MKRIWTVVLWVPFHCPSAWIYPLIKTGRMSFLCSSVCWRSFSSFHSVTHCSLIHKHIQMSSVSLTAVLTALSENDAVAALKFRAVTLIINCVLWNQMHVFLLTFQMSSFFRMETLPRTPQEGHQSKLSEWVSLLSSISVSRFFFFLCVSHVGNFTGG